MTGYFRFKIQGRRVPAAVFAMWCLWLAAWSAAGAIAGYLIANHYGWHTVAGAIIGQLAWEAVTTTIGEATDGR